MTDKPPPSLNLIERMAQRLAKQDGSETKSDRNMTSFSSPSDVSLRAKVPIVRTEPVAEPINPEVRRTSQPVGVPVASQMPDVDRHLPTDGKSRRVQLDFRVLRQNGMITPDNMASVISNEFRGIKRKLLQKARDPETRVAVNNLIMVTSSLPGEGKTFTSVNLAISLAAERGLQVLLLDGDVIRPSIGNMFKSTPQEGLTDLLAGKVKRVSDVMCRCAEIPNLAILFSGTSHINSPELISSTAMADLCTELSTRYSDRIIVIDTPPVLASPEPASLASYVHQLVMVVAADQTDRHQLKKSLDAIASCKNISLLFNKAPRWNETDYTPYYGYASATNAGTPAASS
jgi:receptor protein-tyrosine kinase